MPSIRGADRTAVPVLHAVHIFGLPSETFIRDAIAGTAALGWQPWVLAEAARGECDGLDPDRLLLTPAQLPVVDKLAVRLHGGSDEARARAARGYLAAASKAPPGILHAHFGWTATGCLLAARKLDLPLIVSFHGTDLTGQLSQPEWRGAYKALLARADRVTVVSRFLEERLREFGYDRPIEQIRSGVRMERFPYQGPPRPRRPPRAGSAAGGPRILFVGRLIAVKGVDVLVDAVARVRSAGPQGAQATLRIVGDGPLRGELEALASRAGVENAVAFAGMRRHDEVRAELERADIVVVPSRTLPAGQSEGSNVVSKEAQAVGVPVVAADAGGVPETLPPALRHELVPPNRPDLLAARILELWAAREQWPARSRLQREWVQSEFAWDVIARRLSELYDRVLAEHPPGRRSLQRRLRAGRSVTWGR
ncbi:MAG: glycosyltransferase family 4 protein [Solirubrobacteraceae bacterium]